MSAAGWLSVAEAARRLGVERHSLYDAVARGEVPARRVGRSVRVPTSWVEGADLAASTAPDVERFATEFATAAAREFALLLGAAARAAAPDLKPGTALDDDLTAAATNGEVSHERSPMG